MRHVLPVLLALLLAPGCSRDATVYPSLAERPTEKIGFAEPEAPAPVAVVADPALDARIAALAMQLAAVARGFDGDAGRAAAAGSRAGARTVGSDAWLDAQTALAQLDDWRAQASALTVDAEQLASARAGTLAPDYPALAAVQAAAAAEVARQDGAIGRLQARLPGA